VLWKQINKGYQGAEELRNDEFLLQFVVSKELYQQFLNLQNEPVTVASNAGTIEHITASYNPGDANQLRNILVDITKAKQSDDKAYLVIITVKKRLVALEVEIISTGIPYVTTEGGLVFVNNTNLKKATKDGLNILIISQEKVQAEEPEKVSPINLDLPELDELDSDPEKDTVDETYNAIESELEDEDDDDEYGLAGDEVDAPIVKDYSSLLINSDEDYDVVDEEDDDDLI
jgi:hypothetical protein